MSCTSSWFGNDYGPETRGHLIRPGYTSNYGKKKKGELKAMKDHLERLRQQGIEAIED